MFNVGLGTHDVTNTAAPLYVQRLFCWLLDVQENRGQAMLSPDFDVRLKFDPENEFI